MKKTLRTLLVVVLALILCLAFFGCKDTNDDVVDIPKVEGSIDTTYSIDIEGLSTEKLVVSKAQILEIAKTKGVEYTFEEPCFASDKTDDDGNPIPHSLKGVYLDDILELYADGAVSGSYSALTLKAKDGYETVLTSDTYNLEHGGSKMIVAYEYDGIQLTEQESSGALRAVFPDQVANAWVKKLKTIIFSDAALSPPAPTILNFVEMLGTSYNGSFDKTISTGAGSSDYTFYGISISKLLEGGVLNGEEEDKMYLVAWDFITNGSEFVYREYTNWKSNEYYQNSFLVYEEQRKGGEKEDKNQAPTFDGVNIQKGMSVKNTLALAVKDTALVSLEIAFERYDAEDDNEISLKSVLQLVNMYKSNVNYTIIDIEENTVTVASSALESATITNEDGVYTLQYGTNSMALKSISIAND